MSAYTQSEFNFHVFSARARGDMVRMYLNRAQDSIQCIREQNAPLRRESDRLSAKFWKSIDRETRDYNFTALNDYCVFVVEPATELEPWDDADLWSPVYYPIKRRIEKWWVAYFGIVFLFIVIALRAALYQ